MHFWDWSISYCHPQFARLQRCAWIRAWTTCQLSLWFLGEHALSRPTRTQSFTLSTLNWTDWHNAVHFEETFISFLDNKTITYYVIHWVILMANKSIWMQFWIKCHPSSPTPTSALHHAEQHRARPGLPGQLANSPGLGEDLQRSRDPPQEPRGRQADAEHTQAARAAHLRGHPPDVGSPGETQSPSRWARRSTSSWTSLWTRTRRHQEKR